MATILSVRFENIISISRHTKTEVITTGSAKRHIARFHAVNVYCAVCCALMQRRKKHTQDSQLLHRELGLTHEWLFTHVFLEIFDRRQKRGNQSFILCGVFSGKQQPRKRRVKKLQFGHIRGTK